MGNIKYHLNKGKGKKNHRPIMISYHFNGHRMYYYTGLWIAEGEFNPASKESPARSECIDRIYINTRLTLIRNFIGQVENEALAGGHVLTPELLKNGLNSKLKVRAEKETDLESHVTLMKYFDMFIEDTKTRINGQTGRKLSKAMPVKYNNVKNLFTAFCTHEGRQYDFNDIEENWCIIYCSF